tara:strand:- start:1348 stop:2082 length:735 start_codon:yes stop_codon:yes gene_type:complete
VGFKFDLKICSNYPIGVFDNLEKNIEWEEILKRATHGHLPDVQAGIDASIDEGRELVEQGIATENADVLDLGCGNGRQLAGLVNTGIRSYTGVDPVIKSIQFCNRELASRIPFARFVHLNVRNRMYNPKGKLSPEKVVLPFENDSFDSVITGSVFTHLGTQMVCKRYLEEIARILKPDGKLFSSWFRDPPFKVCSEEARTVFTENDILRMMAKHFEIYYSRGGSSGEWYDQWCLCSRLLKVTDS